MPRKKSLSMSSDNNASTSCSNTNNVRSSGRMNGSSSVGTPRFTTDEKELLFKLFHEYEKLIDIKYRKTLKDKISVSAIWETIMEKYNNSPFTTARRNVKQIQKFWLNSRLRKQYPNAKNDTKAEVKVELEMQLIEETQIKDPLEGEPDYEHEHEQHVEMQASEPELLESVESPNTTQSPTMTPIHTTQQINVDQISAEKLTLTDLLKFKSVRPREDLIVQINSEQPNIIQTPQKIQLTHPTMYKHLVAEIPHQHQITTTQQPTPTTYCTYTTTNLNAYNHVSPPVSNAGSVIPATETFEEKINFYKVKEAELKYKEEQLVLERQRIDLSRAQEELKQSRELNRLQLEEMKIKIRILNEQERQLKKK